MRPSRGRLPAGRGKLINARSRDKSDDDNQKKLTGPIKKRPVVIRKEILTPVQNKKNNPLFNVDNSSSIRRTSRTPKPNPKYNNESVLLMSGNKSREKFGSNSEDDDGDDNEEEDDNDVIVVGANSGGDNDRRGVDNSPDSIFRGFGGTDSSDYDISKEEKIAVPTVRKRGRPPKSAQKSTVQQKINKMSLVPLQQKKKQEPVKSQLIDKDRMKKVKRINIDLCVDSDDDDNDKLSVMPIQYVKKTPPSKVDMLSKKAARPVSTSTEIIEIKESQKCKKNRKINHSEKDDFSTIATSTIDDFETMPTFTIVNINDIINKKGDVLIESTASHDKVSADDYISDDDYEGKSRNNENKIKSLQLISRNRRKTMHTNILSEKIDHSVLKKIPPKGNLIIKRIQQPQRINNNVAKILNKVTSNETVSKPAPRILNSVVSRVARPVMPIITKVQPERKRFDNDDQNGKYLQFKSRIRNEPLQIKSKILYKQQYYKRAASNSSMAQKETISGDWMVIKKTSEKPYAPPAILDVSLITISNAIKEIKLPSNEWSYRITLQKDYSPNMNDSDVYTGEIPEDVSETVNNCRYKPIRVLFRRVSKNPNLQMKFDRAIVLRNNTFIFNMDGKYIRFYGTPSEIKSISDIEAALQLLHETKFNNSLVQHIKE